MTERQKTRDLDSCFVQSLPRVLDEDRRPGGLLHTDREVVVSAGDTGTDTDTRTTGV